MMRPAATVISSSPAREKLQPTALARFLAGSGSRSRGRPARSSPLFSSRSKSVGLSSAATQEAMAAAAAGEEGEPTSPKVTCIGQVRIRGKKSSPAPAKTPPPQPKETRPCQCFHRAFFCSLIPARKKDKGATGAGGRWPWRRWTAPLGAARSGGYRRQEPDSPSAPPLEFIVIKGSDEEDANEEEETKTAALPPKDALLLMRCRSAPHNRASSLATAAARCAVSPLPEPDPPTATAGRLDDPEKEIRRCEPRKIRKKAAEKKKGNDGWSELTASAAEDSSDDDDEEEEEDEEEETRSESLRPLVLPRSRSEPARRRRTA